MELQGNDTVDYSTLTASQNINVTLAGTSASTVNIANAPSDTIKI